MPGIVIAGAEFSGIGAGIALTRARFRARRAGGTVTGSAGGSVTGSAGGSVTGSAGGSVTGP